MTDDPRAHSQARFGRFAEGYVSSATHAGGDDLELVLALAAPQAGWRALDIATGGGHTALKLAPFVRLVVASDLTGAMLQAARRHLAAQAAANVVFCQADAAALPFPDASFELATCRIAAHHFPDIEAFVHESARVLTPGGRLVVQDHMLPADPPTAAYAEALERLRDPSHQRAYNEEEWRRAFAQAGLAVGRMEKTRKTHNLHAWAARQGNSPATIAELERRLRAAPPAVQEWLEPTALGSPAASFSTWHIVIQGDKG